MPPESAPAITDGLQKPRSPWKTGTVDALLLLAILGLANGLIARDDPGFLGLNPTPWILLPLILGMRLGLVAGQIGALLAAGSVFVGFFLWLDRQDIAQLVTEHPYFFVSLLAAGAVGGLVHVLLAGPATAARRIALQLKRSSTRLQHELNLARESEDELARRLLLHGADFVSVQDRARQLFSPQADTSTAGVERGFLKILREVFDVSRAAIYHGEIGTQNAPWQRSGVLGDVAGYAESCQFTAADRPIAAAAIQHREMATCAHLWSNQATAHSSADQPIATEDEGPVETSPASPDQTASDTTVTALAAFPWSSAASEQPVRLLIVDRMPFAAINWESLARIQTLFDWVMSVASSNQGGDTPMDPDADASANANTGPHPSTNLLAPEEFSRQIDLALASAVRSKVAYRLVIFEPTEDATAASQQAFLKRFLTDRRRGDSIGGVHIGGSSDSYAIGLLMPAATDASAECRIAEILRDVPDGDHSVRHQILAIDDDDDRFNQQWNQLIQPAGAAP